MSEASPQEVTVQNPTIQKPDLTGALPGGGAADLSKFGNTEEDSSEAEDAKKREALTQMLSLLGFDDLPATRTDLMNQAGKLQALQAQITAAIQELQNAGGDFAGAGNVAGPPSPENATKIAALNDLQVQLKDAADTFQNYAYSYFASQESDVEKPLSLSQGQILRAYNEGVINKQDAAERLKGLKMSDSDINVLLKLEQPSGGAVRKDLSLKVQNPKPLTGGSRRGTGPDAAGNAFAANLDATANPSDRTINGVSYIKAEDGSWVPASFYNNNGSTTRPSSGGSGGGSGGTGKRMTQAELDALAAKLLERAKGGR